MKTFILLFFSSITLMAEPAALEQARKSYDTEKSKLDEKYVAWLEKMIASAPVSDKGAYRDELAKFSKGKNANDKDETNDPDADWGKVVTIDSQAAQGYKLGRLKAGDRVKIQYVTGIWRAYPGWKEENPDKAITSQHKLAFVMSSREGDTIITNPENTANEPFEYTIIENGDYHIRITGHVLSTNFGKVQYRVEVSR
jgi:hypothetical protein